MISTIGEHKTTGMVWRANPNSIPRPVTLAIMNGVYGVYGLVANGAFRAFNKPAHVLLDNRTDCKLVQTQKSGAHLFGGPAEIIKTLMKGQIPVANTLFLSANFVKNGELTDEIEFILYHNVFFQGKKLRVVGTNEQLASVKAIMQESFFGPRMEDVKPLYETAETMGEAGYFPRELEHFRKGLVFPLKRLNPDRPVEAGLPQLEEFFEFVECNVGESVKLREGKVIAGEEFDTIFTQIQRGKWILSEPYEMNSSTIDTTLFTPMVKPARAYAEKIIEAPNFGVTFLGTGSGFDAMKRTTSFVLWLDGKGIMVDPLADPKGTLHKYGIDEDQIRYVFLTHAHADHDAGVLRMILNGQRINLITSRVIYDSLARKTKAMNVDIDRFVTFTEVKPGEIFDGVSIGLPELKLDIASALHSIPTIRFLAHYDNGQEKKSLFYSADTYFNPEDEKTMDLKKMLTNGTISQERYHSLINFGWEADYIIHEAGMAPIHTPQKVLQLKSGELNKVIHLVHTAKIEEGVTLPIASEGQTLVFVDRRTESKLAVYEALEENPILAHLPLYLAKEVSSKGRALKFKAGETIIQQGSRGHSFYLITEGVVDIVQSGKSVALLKKGNHFGERGLLLGKPRNATAQALTNATLIEVSEELFQKILTEATVVATDLRKTSNIVPALSRLELCRDLPADKVLTLAQKARETSYRAGEQIITQGERGEEYFIIKSGHVSISAASEGISTKVAELRPGEGFGEIALLNNSPRTATVTAIDDTVSYVIGRQDFEQIMNDVPRLAITVIETGQTRLKRTREMLAVRPE